MRGTVVPFQQKFYEMISPSLTPRPPRGTLGQANTGGPVYLDVNGNPITAIACGGSFTFDVPGSGLSQVWLTIYKNGSKGFDGLFSIPMTSYVTTCDSDVGQYQAIAYDPASGIVLGQTSMNILPAGSVVPGGPPPPGGVPGGITSWLSRLTTTEKLIIAGGALLLFVRRKRA
jgi:hypothetical protein